MPCEGKGGKRGAEQTGGLEERALSVPLPRQGCSLPPPCRRTHAGVPADSDSDRFQRCWSYEAPGAHVHKNRLDGATEGPPEQRRQERKQARTLRSRRAPLKRPAPQTFSHGSSRRFSRTTSHNGSCLLSYPLPQPCPRTAPQCRKGIRCRRVSNLIIVSGRAPRQTQMRE